jgi:DNA invertase Pin-like site-specific DNA recombinase
MSRQEGRSIRCAIYTRKSSEEGLEQSFNSLDAQREACLAYIQSQRQEGWRAIPAHYDDGGYSGGSMDRPGLKQLLADIEARKIDTVVVYRVDRLTRNLADFAKIIEAFDAHGVSFVSVTQQFNTTSSMGRLTLNVLLSFAQFEREVTGERIRDKIAASKRKGMWMGGCIPLGYDVRDRRLVVNETEVEQVRQIFHLYLEFGCVKKLKAHLDAHGIKTKTRISKAGNKTGGSVYSRGALYKILANRTYLGQVPHKDQSYPGEHQAIIDPELWEKVRLRIIGGIRGERCGRNAAAPSLLRGLIYDEEGNRFTPSHAVKCGKRYRYYVSQKVIEDPASASNMPGRIPARELEDLVLAEIRSFLRSADRVTTALGNPADDLAFTRRLIEVCRRALGDLDSDSDHLRSEFLAAVVDRIVIDWDSVEIRIKSRQLRNRSRVPPRNDAEPSLPPDESSGDIVLNIPAQLRKYRGEIRLIIPPRNGGQEARQPVPSLVKALARAHDWVRAIISGEYKDQREIAKAIGVNEQYVSRVIAGAFLAPRIVEAIADGQALEAMNLPSLLGNVSLSWKEQRARLSQFPV